MIQLWHRDIGDSCTVDLVAESTIPLIFGVCLFYKGISIVIRLPILSFGNTVVRFCVLDIDFLVQVDSFICDLLTNMPTNKDVLASPGKRS